MSRIDTSRTAISRPFAGGERRFQLRIGEIGELERQCNAGIGGILVRVSTHQFYARDVRATLLLGLVGGGTPAVDAEAMLLYWFDALPIGEHLQLAAEILSACVSGVPPAGEPGAERMTTDPATSPPSTSPAA